MTWTDWFIISLAWLAIGLGVAYAFGRFVRGADAPERTGRPPSLAMWYLRYIDAKKTASPTPGFPDTLIGR